MQDSGFDQPSLRPEGVETLSTNLEIKGAAVANDRHPERNEDAMLILPENRIAAVFDGMGGHAAGDKASQIARDEVKTTFQALLTKTSSFHETLEAIRQTLINANRAVLEQAHAESNNMGTTASVVCLWEGGYNNQRRRVAVGNVGDSRVYLLRNQQLEQITLDDNLASLKAGNEQAARQTQLKFNNTTDPAKQLTKEEQELFRLRSRITQALGGQSQMIEPRMRAFDLLSEDKVMVCSDGISDNLTDQEIQKILSQRRSSTQMAEELVKAAQKRSRSQHFRAKADDITAIVISETETRPRLKKTIQDIPRAESLGQLLDTLKQIDRIEGSKRSYSASELQEVISDVLNGKRPIGTVTRTAGLRAKVAELMTKR